MVNLNNKLLVMQFINKKHNSRLNRVACPKYIVPRQFQSLSLVCQKRMF